MKTGIMSSKTVWTWGVLIAIALAGMAIQMRVTWGGIGLSPDSVNYIQIARGIEAGDGYAIRLIDGTVLPQSHWPPVYPMVLAGGFLAGLQATDTAFWLHAVLMGVNIVLVGWVAGRIGNGSGLAMCAAAGVMACSTEVFAIHVMLASEPLFLTLVLSGVLLLAKSDLTKPMRPLVLAGVLLGFAWLTRYAGVGVIVAGGVCVVWYFRNATLRQHMIAAGVYGLIAVVPTLLWIMWGAWQSGSVGNRKLLWHPPDGAAMQQLYDTAVRWLFPWGDVQPAYTPWLAMVVLGLIVGSWWVVNRSEMFTDKARRMCNVVGLMIVGYVGFLLLSVTLFDAYTQLDFRTLLPVQLLAIPLICGAIVPFMKRVPVAMVVGVVILIAARGVVLAQWVREAPVQSLGYNARGWQESTLMAAIRQLPESPWIYSNRADAIFACTGRAAIPLPRRIDPTQGRPNGDLPEELAKISRQIHRRWAYVVIMRRSGPDYLIAEEELRAIGRLRLIERHRQGTIYRFSAFPVADSPETSPD